MGLVDGQGRPDLAEIPGLRISYSPDSRELAWLTETGDTRVMIAVQPDPKFLSAVDISAVGTILVGEELSFTVPVAGSRTIRALNPCTSYDCSLDSAQVLLHTRDGAPIWLSMKLGSAYLLVLGSNLGEDLTRYRQGDVARVRSEGHGKTWGFDNERPNYLYESQWDPSHPHDRPADRWAMALAQVVSSLMGRPLQQILPGGAPGALVITGDDDQAYLEKYDEQMRRLKGLPITYFLHPATRHTPETLKRLVRSGPVELGLHPDALDAPNDYDAIYSDQAAWFKNLTGCTPGSVRNHGYLNRGYWGHLDSWLMGGVRASSNVPGVDGSVITGSLLPARVTLPGGLTGHWSLLTAIGDGVRFALGKNEDESAACIRALADSVVESKLPGVIVLNLHPQNVGECGAMHDVLHDLVEEGFVAMTMSECIDWFALRQAPSRKRGFVASVRMFFSSWLNTREATG